MPLFCTCAHSAKFLSFLFAFTWLNAWAASSFTLARISPAP
jgi:hypothetical protein